MIELPTDARPVTVVEGDALGVLPFLDDASLDAVVCDPPYPCIDRAYGRWTEAEWFALMDPVVEHCRRVLKSTGSAVFVLQPNSERVGRMRTWLWEFMAKWGREWGVVQDSYWWNTSSLPLAGACKAGLMKPAVKACVWLGPPDCHRDQTSVLWPESRRNEEDRLNRKFHRAACPSRVRSATEGERDNHARLKGRAAERGGTTPPNVFPAGSDGRWSGGVHGHPASTPLPLCRWWVRYICPPDGVVLDPFAGSGNVGVAAIAEGRRAVLIERMPEYAAICRRRITEAMGTGLLASVPA